MKNRCTMSFKMYPAIIAAFATLWMAAPLTASGQLIKTDLAEKEKTVKSSNNNTAVSGNARTTAIDRENTTSPNQTVRRPRITENVSPENVPYQKDTVHQKRPAVATERKETTDQTPPVNVNRGSTSTPARWRKD